jgi:hypothetical protein
MSFAFRSLLLEITVGHPAALSGGANCEEIVGLDIPKFVSEIIEGRESMEGEKVNSLNQILAILMKNSFQIEAGVDFEEVWEFVGWIGLWEESNE